MCGCGELTKRSRCTDVGRGSVQGEHQRYLRGHQRRGKQVARGSDNAQWKGGRVHNSDGYIVRSIDDSHPFAAMGYREKRTPHVIKLLEHRLVMAEYLGRCLTAFEEVHHVNTIRDDNRIENLQLRVKPHGRGAAYVCLDCGSERVAPTRLPEGGDA